jgi:hypothetical protein
MHAIVAIPTNFLPLDTLLYDKISIMPAMIKKMLAINQSEKTTYIYFTPPRLILLRVKI